MWLILCCWATVLGAAACSSEPEHDPEVGQAEYEPQTVGHSCINNAGCDDHEHCQASTHSSTCQCDTGYTACNGRCYDLQTNSANCGSCGNACGNLKTCFGGQCGCDGQNINGHVYSGANHASAYYPGGCGGVTCIDISLDPNCGACAQSCSAADPDAYCNNGAPGAYDAGHCECNALTLDGGHNQLWCSLPWVSPRMCVDYLYDAANCGTCGHACTGGTPYCTNGTCSATCAYSAQCPGSWLSCNSGVCSCPAGQTECSGACFNEQTDPNHCGSCSNVCTGGKTCQAGACACPSGQTDCSGTCRDLQTDEAHCGSCTTGCAAGEHCRAIGAGTCKKDCTYQQDCPSGQICLHNVNPATADQALFTTNAGDPGYCETVSCTTNSDCQANATYGDLDPAGYIAGWGNVNDLDDNGMRCFNNVCIASASDPLHCGGNDTNICPGGGYNCATCLTYAGAAHGCDGACAPCSNYHSKSTPGYWRDCP